MEKKKMKFWKKILIVLGTLIIIFLIAIISYKVYLYIDINNRYKEFEKVETLETKGTLTYLEDENYAKVDNMDYIVQDGIGIKIDSISINDDTFTANVNFKLNTDFDYRTLSYSFAIYDENKNIYEIYSRMRVGENSRYDYNSIFLQNELGVYKKDDIYSVNLGERGGIELVSFNNEEKNVVNKIKIEAKDKFPESKKIYIKILDLGYSNFKQNENKEFSSENVDLSKAKWQFEFDIPEKMNERETINLKLADEIPGLEITKMTISETKLAINFISKDYMDLIEKGKDINAGEFQSKLNEMLNITDGEGKKYQETGGGTTGNLGFKISFDVTKKELSKKLFINFKVGDKQYQSELIEE